MSEGQAQGKSHLDIDIHIDCQLPNTAVHNLLDHYSCYKAQQQL
jgi:hypothetical protein